MQSVLMVNKAKRKERRYVEDTDKMRIYMTEWNAGEAAPCYVEETGFDLLTCIQVAERKGFEVLHRFEE